MVGPLAFLFMGRLLEFDRTDEVFTTPAKKETEDYITVGLVEGAMTTHADPQYAEELARLRELMVKGKSIRHLDIRPGI